jgi:hypothetical protein
LEECGTDTIKRESVQWRAFVELHRKIESRGFLCENRSVFEQQLRELFDYSLEKPLTDFLFLWARQGTGRKGVRLRRFHISEEQSYAHAQENAWYLRNLLNIPNDGRCILIALSTVPQESLGGGSASNPIVLGDGEAQALGPLYKAVSLAYPDHPLRVMVGGLSKEDLRKWKTSINSCHIITLGASDSNPTRAFLLGHLLQELHEQVTGKRAEWLDNFHLSGEQGKCVVRFFTTYQSKIQTTGWNQRYIIVRLTCGDGKKGEQKKEKNYAFDTSRPSSRAWKKRTLRVFDHKGKEMPIHERTPAARHEDVAVLNLAMDHPSVSGLKWSSLEGSGTFGSGAAALALTDPEVTDALWLKAGAGRGPASSVVVSAGGAVDLYPLTVEI